MTSALIQTSSTGKLWEVLTLAGACDAQVCTTTWSDDFNCQPNSRGYNNSHLYKCLYLRCDSLLPKQYQIYMSLCHVWFIFCKNMGLLKMLGQKKQNISSLNGGLKVIYHSRIRKKITFNFNKKFIICKQQQTSLISWHSNINGAQSWTGCISSYCWWFRNPARKPVEVGSVSHHSQAFYIPGGAGFFHDIISFAAPNASTLHFFPYQKRSNWTVNKNNNLLSHTILLIGECSW